MTSFYGANKKFDLYKLNSLNVRIFRLTDKTILGEISFEGAGGNDSGFSL